MMKHPGKRSKNFCHHSKGAEFLRLQLGYLLRLDELDLYLHFSEFKDFRSFGGI